MADFLGADRGLKRLCLLSVSEITGTEPAPPDVPEVSAGESLEAAPRPDVAAGAEGTAVRGDWGAILGSVTLLAIRAARSASDLIAWARSNPDR